MSDTVPRTGSAGSLAAAVVEGVTEVAGRPGTRRAARTALAGLGIGLGLGAVVSAASSGLAAYFARKIVVPGQAPENVQILHVDGFDDDMHVHLSADEETIVPGRYGLWFDGGRGHAQIGDILEYDPWSRTVSRQVLGVPHGDLRTATSGRWTGTFYPDPECLELPYEDIVLTTEVGDLPAWWFPTAAAEADAAGDEAEPVARTDSGQVVAGRDTWAVLIHGRGATRAEGLRAVPVLDALGIPSLAISYRNDAEVRVGNTARYGLGDTEWIDIDAAIDFALAHGARRVVLVGWSMGGAIAFQAASRGRNRRFVSALVLDGPVVDWYSVLDHQARENFLPTPVARLTLDMISRPWAQPITGLETPLDLDRLDWVTRAAELDVPMLLVHSDDDDFVPSGPSHALANVRRDLVTMPHYEKARHTKEWNVDPVKWEDDVARFLSGHLGLGD
ncbi:alpha/beta hydrolase family protein [Brevibacterium litoralis]|uniref:alpha/beta hydrolase family protein n=1 Tax=Brevibacterium litoralis TaxID=3138935 RepID=UPI0032ECBFCD